MSENIINIKITEIDVNKFTYSEPKQNKSGQGKSLNILYDGKMLNIIFPKMETPFGISRFEDKTKRVSYSFGLSLDNLNENSELKNAYKKCIEIDEKFKVDGFKFKKEWLQKQPKTSKDVIEDLYRPLVNVPKDKEGNILNYPSRLKMNLNLDQKNNFMGFKVFTSDKNGLILNLDNYENIIGKRDQVKSVVSLNRIWISAMGFGPSLYLKQLRVFKNQSALNECILDDSDEEENDEVEEIKPQLKNKGKSVEEVKKELEIELEEEDVSDEEED